jgi:hypothetical protein
MGEFDVVGNERAINKKTKCRKCGQANDPSQHKEPEIVFLKRKAPEQP